MKEKLTMKSKKIVNLLLLETHKARSGSLKNECGSNIEYGYSITRGFLNGFFNVHNKN